MHALVEVLLEFEAATSVPELRIIEPDNGAVDVAAHFEDAGLGTADGGQRTQHRLLEPVCQNLFVLHFLIF